LYYPAAIGNDSDDLEFLLLTKLLSCIDPKPSFTSPVSPFSSRRVFSPQELTDIVLRSEELQNSAVAGLAEKEPATDQQQRNDASRKQ
jgi:hypothetical protein